MQAYVVVHEFGELGGDVPADALLVQVVPHIGGVGQYLVERIDDTVAHVELSACFRGLHGNAHLVGVAAQFVVGAMAPVVDIGEAVDAHTV